MERSTLEADDTEMGVDHFRPVHARLIDVG
jgi:hypothetical protein